MLSAPRSTLRYQSVARDRAQLRVRLRDLAASRVHYGYRRLHILLKREGWQVNHKLVYRLYVEEGLQMRRKRPRRNRSCQVRTTAIRNRHSTRVAGEVLQHGCEFTKRTLGVDHPILAGYFVEITPEGFGVGEGSQLPMIAERPALKGFFIRWQYLLRKNSG